MKNLNRYKSRFNKLMESTMGNVRPLTEQYKEVEDELEEDHYWGPPETDDEDVLTVDDILEEVKNALDDLGGYEDSMEDAARELAKDILLNIKDDLAYLSENYEEALQDILDGNDSESEEINEEETNNNGKNLVNKTKETVRTVGNSGEYDYNYIENTIPINKIAKLINDSITGNIVNSVGKLFSNSSSTLRSTVQDNEAVVEALFIRILKERDPIAAFNQVRQDYYKQFNSDMMTDIKDDIDINQKYHKESIASLLAKIQKSKSGGQEKNKNEEVSIVTNNDKAYDYKFVRSIENRMYCKYYYRPKTSDGPWIEATGNALSAIIKTVKFTIPKCKPGDMGPPKYNFK